jgi:uncharacterized membrane protein
MASTDLNPPPKARSRGSRLKQRCILSGEDLPLADLVPLALLRPALLEQVKARLGAVPPDAMISRRELERLRTEHVSDLLRQERGELTALEQEVVQSLAAHDILAANVEQEIEQKRSLGDRLADHLATFGGSWAFLSSFAVVLAIWMTINGLRGPTAFDPFPFILLNLVLSCLAAVQAPIIMMSQRRQEAKDRVRSLNDYQVNLKAELEIRHLHEKIDHILTRQWDRLVEIQEVQIELLQELAERRPPDNSAPRNTP